MKATVEESSGMSSSVSYAPINCHTTKQPLDFATSSLLSQWLQNSQDSLTATGEEELLINSPYHSQHHLLRLSSIGRPQRLLAKALTVMAPLRDDFAIAPYVDAFNWSSVVSVLKSLVGAESYAWKHQLFYIVVFRSQVPPTTDRLHLAALDKRSHAEAMESGGLLKYWFGIPDANGRNIATCKSPKQSLCVETKQPIILGIWREREDAKRGSIGLGHKEAMRAMVNMYSEWKLERLTLVIGDNVESWSIMDWEERTPGNIV